MLVAKLDFLQYIAVRSFSNNIGARLKALWKSRVKGEDVHEGGEGEKNPKQDVISKDEKKVQPMGGRMPNAAGGTQTLLLIFTHQSKLAL